MITGASRGLGAGLAETLAAEGVRLGLCARTRPDAPRAATSRSPDSVDVTDADAVERFAAEVVDRFGPDRPVGQQRRSAGPHRTDWPTPTPTACAANVEVNVLGVLHGIGHLRPPRAVADPAGGVLVNLSSGAATRPYEGWAAYGGAKAAVDMITEVVAREERSADLAAYALARRAWSTPTCRR